MGLAYVLSGDRSLAEDYAQEAFAAAYRNWDKVSTYSDPAAWTRRVLANRVTSGFRRSITRTKALLRVRSEEYVIPEMEVLAESTWKEVRGLPARQAQVVALRFYDQRGIAEIAAILDCSPSTVKTHLQRAKATLAKRLENREH